MFPELARDLPDLETERLLLRAPSYSDVADIFEYASDPEVALHTLWEPHQTHEDTRNFLDFIFDQRRSARAIIWAMVHKTEGRVIGTIGLANCSHQHSRAELGFAIGRRCWNQGYTSEAVAAVLRSAFHELRFNRIEAFCKVENLASARVLEKSGLRFEGILRQRELIKGRFEDLKLYAMLHDEYLASIQPEERGS
jgi:ribosomal-protein-alanine N-acetyltransferase